MIDVGERRRDNSRGHDVGTRGLDKATLLQVRVGVRDFLKFRDGIFVFFFIRVFRSHSQNYPEIVKSRHFGYPIFRDRVREFPDSPE